MKSAGVAKSGGFAMSQGGRNIGTASRSMAGPVALTFVGNPRLRSVNYMVGVGGCVCSNRETHARA